MQGKHHLEIGKPKNRPALCSQKYQTYILSIFVLTQRTGLFFYFSFALRLSFIISSIRQINYTRRNICPALS